MHHDNNWKELPLEKTSAPKCKLQPALVRGFPAPIPKQTRMLGKDTGFSTPQRTGKIKPFPRSFMGMVWIMLVFSWGSLASNLPTLLNRWLLACFPKSCGAKKTWEVIWKHLHWSFETLACGRRLTVDPDGKPLKKGSVFFSMKGQLLYSQGLKGVLWSVIGGHEFFSNTLGLPHWASHFPCWECDAENFTPCAFGKRYKEICLEKQRFVLYTHEECVGDPWSDHAISNSLGSAAAWSIKTPPYSFLQRNLWPCYWWCASLLLLL